MQIRASDADEGENSKVRYKIVGPQRHQNALSIDENTGELNWNGMVKKLFKFFINYLACLSERIRPELHIVCGGRRPWKASVECTCHSECA